MIDGTTPPPYPQPVYPQPQPSQIVDNLRYFTDSGFAWLTKLGLLSMVTNEITEEQIAFASRLRPEIQQAIVTTSRDLQPVWRWQNHRESYAVHPTTTRSITRLKSTTKIPGAALRGLRHPDPLILLPGAPPIQHADGHQGRIVAFYITGAISGRYAQNDAGVTITGRNAQPLAAAHSVLRSTHDPKINAYHIMVVSEVHSPDGTQVIDSDYSHLTLPIRDEFTLDELVEETVSDFSWAPEMLGTLTATAKEAYIRTQATVVLTHLLYVISKSAEIAELRNDRPPVKWKKASGKPKPAPPAKVRQVGYRLGAAIKAAQHRAAQARSGPGTGRTLAPHVRGSHLHLYRVGKGRQEIDIKLLGPIPVNIHADDGRTVTIHPVK